MTHQIIKEWLVWFDSQIRVKGKKVLLLIDNFLAYKLAVKQIKANLTHTKVSISYFPLIKR